MNKAFPILFGGVIVGAVAFFLFGQKESVTHAIKAVDDILPGFGGPAMQEINFATLYPIKREIAINSDGEYDVHYSHAGEVYNEE